MRDLSTVALKEMAGRAAHAARPDLVEIGETRRASI